MAAVTLGINTASTLNVTSYASGSFTPVLNDLLVALVVASDTVATGSMTDSQALGFTKVTSVIYNLSRGNIYCFVANAFAAASAMTVTFNCTGDAATGAVVCVARVSGMSRKGLAAIRQSAGQASISGPGTPAPAFASAVLTGNPTLGIVGNVANPATLTPPTGWTEQGDVGYATPVVGAEWVSRASGFTGTTITWGSSSTSNFGDLIVELDTSAAPAFSASRRLLVGQAVKRASYF